MRNPPNERGLNLHPSPSAEGPGVGAVELAASSGTSPTPTPPLKGRGSHTPERTCILSRRTAPRADLIRLALGPDGQIAPDIRARAPGRGAWLSVDRATLDAANAKGRLKGALARAFKRSDLTIPADLGEKIETALRQDALNRLGLEARAGHLVTGSERIEDAARAGQVHALLHAADAGADGNRKLDQAWRVGGEAEGTELRGLVLPAERPILSMALGRENVVHVAITDRAAAARVNHALARWRAFIGADVQLSAATAGTPDAAAMSD